MSRKTAIILIASILLGLSALGNVFAGAALDRILNSMVLDCDNGGANTGKFKTITPENPIGQTFTTGENIVEVSRIAIAVAYWNESWTEDESLLMTLWDSPEKKVKLAEFAMPYKWREWEGQVMMFPLEAKVQPKTSYYFELTVQGGDGKFIGVFCGDKYDCGQAYEAGKPAQDNIWFQIHSRPVYDRDAAFLDRFSNWNLDYPGLEKVKAAVEKKDWDAAVDELISYYESRPDLINPNREKPGPKPGYDRSYDDLVADMKIKDDEGNIIELGPNWNHYRTWRTRGGVGLTRSGIMKYLVGGYRNTGDEKFAKAFNDMQYHTLQNQPCPIRAGVMDPNKGGYIGSSPAGIRGGSMWSALSIGARMNQMWYWYEGVVDSPNFTKDIRAAMIFNMVDMANVLSLQFAGGNWEAQMASALYEFAERHPELKKSREWFNKGINTVFQNLMECVYPDGVLQEPTYNYHCLTTNRYTRTLQICKQLDISVKPEWKERTEKAVEFIMYSTQPDWNLPARGDTYSPFEGIEYCQRMADYYNREDFRWAGSKGREGKKPAATSAAFQHGGWYIMRNDWTPDALYMNIFNGTDRGHGHHDQNSITLFAYGNSFITDPGVYAYGTSETKEMTYSISHATVTVDDSNTIKQKGTNKWASTKNFDYYSGTGAGYEGVKDITHNRKIIFFKESPAYWLIIDTVKGSGEHNVCSRFPFEPCKLALNDKTGACHTNNERGNLLISPEANTAFKAELYAHKVNRGGLKEAPGVRYCRSATLPADIACALYPYKGKNVPRVIVKKLADGSYLIDTPETIDKVFLGCGANAKGDVAIVRTYKSNGKVIKEILVAQK